MGLPSNSDQIEQYNRLIAHVNMTPDTSVNCEECGCAIPVELTRCNKCEDSL
jgi:hypothetical protein